MNQTRVEPVAPTDPSQGFQWGPPPTGFCWVTIPRKGRYLAPAAPGTGRPRTRAVPPRLSPRRTDLFRDFAALQPTEVAVLKFVNEYGCLGVGDPIPLVHHPRDVGRAHIRGPRSAKLVRLGQGESLDTWRREIRAMRTAIDVWTALRESDLATLRARIVRVELTRHAGTDTESAWYYVVRSPSRRRLRLSQDLIVAPVRESTLPTRLRDLVERHDLRRDDVRRLAEWFLRRRIDERLWAHTAARQVYDAERDRWRTHLRPRNLLGALWYQFARAVDGLPGWRPCQREGCPQWVEPGRGRGRHAQMYHSTSCRVMHYQARVAEALRRFGRGEHPEEIAAALGTKAETARTWIARGLHERGELAETIAARLDEPLEVTHRRIERPGAKSGGRAARSRVVPRVGATK